MLLLGHLVAADLADASARPIIELPADSRCANVREYGAVGDGRTDDTEAFRKAVSANFDFHSRPIYVPPGTYLITDTIQVRKPDGKTFFGTKLIGHSQDTTIIRLKDACPGFTDPSIPKHIIRLCSRDQEVGGNMGHWNSLINLTIDSGKGNPGCKGVEYIASNEGSLRDLTIRSGDGAGICGVDMTAPWPGPCLLDHVTIEGFDHAVMTKHGLYSVTFKDLTLRGQRRSGLQNDGNMLCITGLRSSNAVPVVAGKGKLVLLHADMEGGSANAVAIDHSGPTYLRKVRSSGYAGVRRGSANEVAEWIDQEGVAAFGEPKASLNLPWEDTPRLPYEPAARWRNGGGTAASMQAAIDSGAATVYIPWAEHWWDKTVIIRGNVRRIVGMYAIINRKDKTAQYPLFRFEGQQSCVIEFLNCKGTIEHASKAPLIVRQVNGPCSNTAGCGPLFVEDNCSARWSLDHPSRVYMYQFNPESPEWNLKVKGTQVFICGFKSEREGLQVQVDGGGAVEILGGVIYPCHAVPKDRPMFEVIDGGLSAFITYFSFVPDGIHAIKLRETRGGETKNWTGDCYGRLLTAWSQRPDPEPGITARKKLEKEQAASTPAADERPAPPDKNSKALPADVLAAWDKRLYRLVRSRVEGGRGPTIPLKQMRTSATVLEADDQGTLVVRLTSGGTVTLPWRLLSQGERCEAALGAAHSSDVESMKIAAVFCFLEGRDHDARMRLSDLGSEAYEVLDLFPEDRKAP